MRAVMNVPAGAQIPLAILGASADVRTRVNAWMETLKRLARLSEISFVDAAPAGSAQIIVRGTSVALPLAGVIDISAERGRLTKEIGKLQGEISKIDAKLNNADFVRRAPEDVVEENRVRREDATSRIA